MPSCNRKHAVENTEMLDFLKELVQDIPDPSAGGTIDLDGEGAENKKKRGKGKRPANVVAGPTTNPADPDAPAPPKRKRRKKKDILEAAAAAAAASSSDANRMVEDSHGAGTEAEDHDYDGPAVPQKRRLFDDDTSMQDNPDEYDEDDSLQPPPETGASTVSMSYRPRSPVEDDYED